MISANCGRWLVWSMRERGFRPHGVIACLKLKHERQCQSSRRFDGCVYTLGGLFKGSPTCLYGAMLDRLNVYSLPMSKVLGYIIQL